MEHLAQHLVEFLLHQLNLLHRHLLKVRQAGQRAGMGAWTEWDLVRPLLALGSNGMGTCLRACLRSTG